MPFGIDGGMPEAEKYMPDVNIAHSPTDKTTDIGGRKYYERQQTREGKRIQLRPSARINRGHNPKLF